MRTHNSQLFSAIKFFLGIKCFDVEDHLWQVEFCMSSSVPTQHSTLNSPLDFTTVIRFCYMAGLTLRRTLCPIGFSWSPGVFKSRSGCQRLRKFETWNRRYVCAIAGLKMWESLEQGTWKHLGAQSRPQLTSKKRCRTFIPITVRSWILHYRNIFTVGFFFGRRQNSTQYINFCLDIPWAEDSAKTCRTSGLQNCEVINRCYFKPLSLW